MSKKNIIVDKIIYKNFEGILEYFINDQRLEMILKISENKILVVYTFPFNFELNDSITFEKGLSPFYDEYLAALENDYDPKQGEVIDHSLIDCLEIDKHLS